MDRTGKPGQDTQDMTSGTGNLGQATWDRKTGQDRQERSVLIRNAKMVKFYPLALLV